jgi:hypothetical protein
MGETTISTALREDPVSRMRRLQSGRRTQSGEVMDDIYSAYFGTARDRLVGGEVDQLVDSFLLAEGASTQGSTRCVGRLKEGRALAIIGGSGTGKSRTLDRHFLKREEFAGYGDPNSDCPLISLTVPSPCTPRLLGMSILNRIPYTISRELKENVVWELVHHQLQLRGIRFLHLDELQHVQQSRNVVEIKKVQDSLKSLMQSPRWPVWLILSGLPSITSMLSGDEDAGEHGDQQVWRRTRFVVFEDLDLAKDTPLVRHLLRTFAGEKAALSIDALESDEFIARLLHASIYRLGIGIEFVQDAIWNALLQESRSLGMEHFAAAFAARTGCLPADNVFNAALTDWHLIDPRKVLQRKVQGASQNAGELPAKFKAPRDTRNK